MTNPGMRVLLYSLALLGLARAVEPVQSGWRPIPGPSQGPGPTLGPTLGPGSTALLPRTFNYHAAHAPRPHMCTLYKASFDQDTFQQYVQYKTQIPDMKEFTLCLWHRFFNHTKDQPLFYYGHRDKSREIYSWVANTESASFYSMAINGQTMYRLNYPVRLHKWYHLCQSWNGKTGEWQIWVNAERIGRGFHNLLVGKPVRGGGMAVTGQEQLRYTSGPRKPVSIGLVGEVTVVQLYKAALTAGKAYTNHKHHHVHHFHHEDKLGEDDYAIMSSTQPPPPTAQPSQHPFLSNGQLIPMLPVSELSAFRGQMGPNAGLYSPFSDQLDIILPGMQRLFKRDQEKGTGTMRKRTKKSEESDGDLPEEAAGDILKVEPKGTRKAKRDTSEMESLKSKNMEEDILKDADEKMSDVKKRQAIEEEYLGEEKSHQKRNLFQEQFQYGLIPGDDLSGLFPGDGYVLGGGGVRFDGESEKEPAEMVQMEPAEWEVRSIMGVCTGCSEDPFRKAAIISWRETPKKLYAGGLYVPAVPECQRF